MAGMFCTHLTEHSSTSRCPGGFVWRAVNTHGFPVAGELEGEFLLPHLLDYMTTDGSLLSLVEARLVCVIEVTFLHQDGEGGLSGLPYFLVNILGLFENRDLLNPYAMNGHSHPFHLDEFTFTFRGTESNFSS